MSRLGLVVGGGGGVKRERRSERAWRARDEGWMRRELGALLGVAEVSVGGGARGAMAVG